MAFYVGLKALNLKIVSTRPLISIAAAAIYMASNASVHSRTMHEITSVTGLSENCIRKSYELMYPHSFQLFPDN